MLVLEVKEFLGAGADVYLARTWRQGLKSSPLALMHLW